MKPAHRHRARRHVLQALYQTLFAGQLMEDVAAQHLVDMDKEKVDVEYFQLLTQGVLEHLEELDAMLLPCLDRSLEELTPIELSVLRLASFELIYCSELPCRVVLNEALELTKKFGTQDGYKFVNGVLDKLVKEKKLV